MKEYVIIMITAAQTCLKNIEEKEMIPLTNKEIKRHEKQKVYYICKKKICDDKNKKKVRHHCHYTGKFRGAAHGGRNLRYKIPKEIPIVFHNGSTYDYHLIIKKLAQEKIQKNILLFQCRLKK